MLIHNDKILVIFQYLQAKYCNDSKITKCCFKLRKQLTHKYLDVLALKKTPYFLLLQFYDAAKKAKKSAQAARAFGIKHQNNFKNMVV